MTKIALTTEPTPMLAKTSPSDDPSNPSSLRSTTGISAGSIVPALKASASAPAGSVKTKNGSDARLAIKEMKRPDGDIKFIIHVAAVSCAATAVPETKLANQILRKTRFRQALGVAFHFH
jgi:hypothetical protein